MTQKIDGMPSPDQSGVHSQKIGSDDISIERAQISDQPFSVRETEESGLLLEGQEFSLENISEVEEATKEIISNLLEDEQRLKQLFKFKKQLPVTEAPTVDAWSDAHAMKLLEVAKAQVESAVQWGEFVDTTFEIPGEVTEVLEKWIGEPLENYMGEFSEKIPLATLEAKFAFKIPEILGKGGSLIYKRIMLKNIQSIIDKVENQLDESSDLETVKKWVEIQNAQLSKQAIAFGFATAKYAPTGAKAILELLDKMSATAGLAIGWGNLVTGVALNGYQVYRASIDVSSQEEWMKMIKDEPLSTDALQKDVSTLLTKRKSAFNQKMVKNTSRLTDWLSEMLSSDKSFDQIQTELQSKGIYLEESISNLDQLKLAIEDKSGPYINLVKQFTQHQETISQLTRNGLKSLNELKLKKEKRFLDFKLNKSRASLVLSTIVSVTCIVIKTLAFVGVMAIPVFGLALSGVGLAAAGIGLMAIGLMMFYRHKPNLFKAFFKGVNLRLALYEIPYSFRKFQTQLNKVKLLEKNFEVYEFQARAEELKGILDEGGTIQAKTLPDRLKPLMKKLKINKKKILSDSDIATVQEQLKQLQEKEGKRFEGIIEKLNNETERLSQKTNSWKSKIKPLQDRLESAGFADFVIAHNFAKSYTGEEMKIDEVLTDGILIDDDLLDDKTKEILQNQMGINIETLRESDDVQQVRQDVKDALVTFFSMDDTELVKLVNRLKPELSNG